MAEQFHTQKKTEEVKKPTLIGSFCGADAKKLAFRRFLSMFAVLIVYLLSAFLFSFDALWLRVIFCAVTVTAVTIFLYSQGASQGENDASFGEIMYVKQQEGQPISQADRDRCFHPLKGFFAVFLGVLPFFIAAVYFACKTQLIEYSLGALPSWTETLMENTDFSDSLGYYAANQQGFNAFDILRIVIRGFIMPFINVSVSLGNKATLLVEQFSPLLMLIAPLGYAVGYAQGIQLRVRVNTSIKLGVEKKKKRERKERKQRQRAARKPEQLI